MSQPFLGVTKREQSDEPAGETSDKKRFELVESRVVGDGVLILVHQRSS